MVSSRSDIYDFDKSFLERTIAIQTNVNRVYSAISRRKMSVAKNNKPK